MCFCEAPVCQQACIPRRRLVDGADNGPAFAGELLEQRDALEARRRVESGRRLVEEHHRRVVHLRSISGNTKGGSIAVPLTSCFTGLDLSVLQKKYQLSYS